MPGHLVDRPLDGIVGGRLTEGPHRLLHGLVRSHGYGAVLYALDAVRTDNGADRLSQLERRAPCIRADIVERAQLHGADHAAVVERDLDIEVAFRPMRVAAAHVLQPILDQPHGKAEPARKIAGQHRMLDAALHSIAAAHVHVVVGAHARARQLERQRELVGKARHLYRGEHVEHFPPRIPACQHPERLDRHGGAATPSEFQREPMRILRKVALDLAPGKSPIEEHVRGVLRVHRGTARRVGLLPIEYEWQSLVIHGYPLGRVLGERAGIRHDGGHPFPGVARDIHRQRPALHFRGIEARQQRLRRRGKLVSVQHVMDARHRERIRLVDGGDPRGRIGTTHQRDMPRSRKHHIRGKPAFARDKAPILADAAIGGDITPACRRRAHVALAGRLRPRMRSAASATASMI